MGAVPGDEKDGPMIRQRGALTPEQVDLVMQALPCDVSFADERDVLVYWQGETYKTCDARYIGRDVRDCHPEQSLDVLETILSAFKTGARDEAWGWGTGSKGFKLTRYFAVRDAKGVYRGILEVNQSLDAERALQGEQSMPGW
jgi:uncharacterized protein